MSLVGGWGWVETLFNPLVFLEGLGWTLPTDASPCSIDFQASKLWALWIGKIHSRGDLDSIPTPSLTCSMTWESPLSSLGLSFSVCTQMGLMWDGSG